MTFAQENRKTGGIVSIDAANCLIELIDIQSTKVQSTQETSHTPKELVIRKNRPEPLEISDPANGEIHIHQPDPAKIPTTANSQTHIVDPDSMTADSPANIQSRAPTQPSSRVANFRKTGKGKRTST